MSSRGLILILGLLILAFCSSAQSVQLLDISNQKPIVGATASNQTTGSTSDVNGNLSLKAFALEDTIEIGHVGYKTLSGTKKRWLAQHYVYLEPLALNLKTVTISSSKFEQELQEVAQNIHIIDSKTLDFQSNQTAADALEQSGKVLVQKSQGGGGSPIIRGFEANKVLIVIDGVRMNNAIYRGGHLQNVITLDNAILDRSEVLFGPGSIIYGSDALGGVMHFVTKDPLLSRDSSIRIQNNSYIRYSTVNKENSIHSDIGISNQKFGSLSSFTLSSFGDLRKGARLMKNYSDWGARTFFVLNQNGVDTIVQNKDINLQKFSGYTQYDMLQKFIFKPNEDQKHKLNFQYSTSTNIPRYDRLAQLNNDSTPKFAHWYYGPQKRFFSAYSFETQKSSTLYDQLMLTTAYQHIEESRYNRRFQNTLLGARIERLNIVSLNLDAQKSSDFALFQYGIEALHNHVNSSAFTQDIITGQKGVLDTRYPDDGSDYNSLAAYTTLSKELSSTFMLKTGIRYSTVKIDAQIKDTTFFAFLDRSIAQQNNALNGNFALIGNQNNYKFSFIASSGFRAPNVDDLGKIFESVQGTVVVPNTNIEPEYTYNLEFNLNKMRNKGLLGFQTSLFYTWYRNALTTVDGSLNGNDSIFYDGVQSKIVMLDNAQNAFIYGANASIEIALTHNTILSSTLNYTYGRIVEDTLRPLDHIPPLFGKTSITHKRKALTLEVFAMYNGFKRTKDYNLLGEDNFSKATPDGTPAWMTLNLRSQYQINDQFSVQLNVLNLLDQSYRVFASGIHAPGRNISITLRAQF